MSYTIDIPCMSGNVKAEQREAFVETTTTGVRWHITGKLAAAIGIMVRENGMTTEERDFVMRARMAGPDMGSPQKRVPHGRRLATP